MWQELSLPIILSSSRSEGEGKWTLISGVDSLAFSSTFRSVPWARGSRVFSLEREEGGTDNEWDIRQRCPCFCFWCLSLPCRLITHGFHKHMAGWWLSRDYFTLWGTHCGPVTLFFHFSTSPCLAQSWMYSRCSVNISWLILFQLILFLRMP